jgi:hypothetical protein
MTQDKKQGLHTLEDLFALTVFRIPQYQRAYSWEVEPHLEAFLDDLRQQVGAQQKSPSKQYFLGTFLLHEENDGGDRMVVNIVDGQQRMTTSVVLVATALALHEQGRIGFQKEKSAVLKRNFVYDSDERCQKFHTILEDDPFFQSAILRISGATCEQDSPSSRRLSAAADFFTKNVVPDEWESLLHVLKRAKVLVYSVDSAEEATQIFELQNDRGKPLTDLEALKSFLMHCMYLHSTSSAEDRLAALQIQFAKIYRTVESLSEWRRAPNEDQILANHCAAFLRWSEAEYRDPKHFVKSSIKSKDGEEVVRWIEEFVSSLVQSYKAIEELFKRIERSELGAFAELLLLGRMGPMWPLVLKVWRFDDANDKHNFLKVCRLLEVFTFRGYAIANLRSDTGSSSLLTWARDFDGDCEALCDGISEMCTWYNVNERFAAGLDNAQFYENENGDALYLLWRYENHLRGQPGKKVSPVPWRDLVETGDYGTKLSVEHVAAQGNPIADTVVSWQEGEPKKFSEVALHRLGNLVIDTISSNASKGKKDFSDKLKSLSENSTYLSQGELIRFLPRPNELHWGVEAVRARHEHLTEFAKKTWDPRSYHQASEKN